MCNVGNAISRAFSTGGDGAGGAVGSPAPAPAPTPAPAPAPTPAPAPAPERAPTPAPTPAPPSIDYASLARGYTDFARPEIERQYANASDALSTGLVERGLGNSSIGKQYNSDLSSAYSGRMSGLPAEANTYAHGDTSRGFTPLGDLFTSIINPVASFNGNNRYKAPQGMAPIAGAEHVGSGGSTGTETVTLAGGGKARVVG